MPERDEPAEPTHCHGCGRLRETCAAASCGRDAPDDPLRFCPRCGWRLRDIAAVPGMGAQWCRLHGVVTGD